MMKVSYLLLRPDFKVSAVLLLLPLVVEEEEVARS